MSKSSQLSLQFPSRRGRVKKVNDEEHLLLLSINFRKGALLAHSTQYIDAGWLSPASIHCCLRRNMT